MKKIRVLSMILTAALLLTCSAMADIIPTTNVNLRTGAGANYSVITTVPEGTHLEYVDEKTDKSGNVTWYRVKYGGKKGWVSAKYAENDGIDNSIAANYDLTNLSEFDDVSVYFGQNLRASAEHIGLVGYQEQMGDFAQKYFDDCLTLGGEENVELIALFGGEYTIFGVAPGMKDNDAAQILCDAGMLLTAVEQDELRFAHVDSAGEVDSMLALTVTEDIVTGVEWSLLVD